MCGPVGADPLIGRFVRRARSSRAIDGSEQYTAPHFAARRAPDWCGWRESNPPFQRDYTFPLQTFAVSSEKWRTWALLVTLCYVGAPLNPAEIQGGVFEPKPRSVIAPPRHAECARLYRVTAEKQTGNGIRFPRSGFRRLVSFPCAGPSPSTPIKLSPQRKMIRDPMGKRRLCQSQLGVAERHEVKAPALAIDQICLRFAAA